MEEGAGDFPGRAAICGVRTQQLASEAGCYLAAF